MAVTRADPTPLKTAVIGLGRMGMHHVRACVDLAETDLCAVLDHKPDWAVQVGADTRSLVATDVDSLIGKIDAAIIAVPAQDHATTAVPLLQRGIACLVEKPIAATEHESEAILRAAQKGGAILRIGHIERFNPAVSAAAEAIDDADNIKRITAKRHTPQQDRPYDVDAVLDLMIHDLDLAEMFGCGQADSVAVTNIPSPEAVNATITYDTGAMADLSVHRGAEHPERTLVLELDGKTYEADLARQTLRTSDGSITSDYPVQPADALRAQMKDFVAAIQEGSGRGATGDDGQAALSLANRVRAEAGLMS